VKTFLAGAFSMLILLLVSGVTVMRLGLVPVNADGSHSSVEARIMPVALHASSARHAPEQTNPVQLGENSLKSAAGVYKAVCAQCHGTPSGNPNVFGQSFYPPASQLSGGLPVYTDSQLFWIIKHGIRNTGMPAWGNLLTDESIWQIVSLLKHAQDLPPSVESEWSSRKSGTPQ
jgi:mono/diheme cytochrome c family protein